MTRHITAALSASLLVAHAWAAEPPDPDRTLEALSPLLAAAEHAVPKASSCYGNYGQRGALKVRHVLASRLAFLHNGSNVIAGSCTANRCELTVQHAAGEDVASATFTFAIGGGVARVATMACAFTP